MEVYSLSNLEGAYLSCTRIYVTIAHCSGDLAHVTHISTSAPAHFSIQHYIYIMLLCTRIIYSSIRIITRTRALGHIVLLFSLSRVFSLAYSHSRLCTYYLVHAAAYTDILHYYIVHRTPLLSQFWVSPQTVILLYMWCLAYTT